MIVAMRTGLDRWALLTVLALVLVGGGAVADDGGDHDRARRALEEGRARPLAEILEQVRDRLGGEVIGIEFEREHGRYVYEFDVVTPDGRLREVEVDALTAEILKTEED